MTSTASIDLTVEDVTHPSWDELAHTMLGDDGQTEITMSCTIYYTCQCFSSCNNCQCGNACAPGCQTCYPVREER